MKTFPVAHSIWCDRGLGRRIEFRRIKKQFEKMANINDIPEIDAKNLKDQSKFEIRYYNDYSD